MSFAASARAMEVQLPGNPLAKLVLIGISEFTDENHIGELDLDYLAVFAGVPVTQAAKAIDALVALSLLRILDVPLGCVQILGVRDGD